MIPNPMLEHSPYNPEQGDIENRIIPKINVMNELLLKNTELLLQVNNLVVIIYITVIPLFVMIIILYLKAIYS